MVQNTHNQTKLEHTQREIEREREKSRAICSQISGKTIWRTYFNSHQTLVSHNFSNQQNRRKSLFKQHSS